MALVSHKAATRLFLILLIVILGYTGYTARHMLVGPTITFGDVQNPLTTTVQIIEITGVAGNTETLAVNGRALTMSPDGTFTERMLLQIGLNTFTFGATDRFGRTEESVLEVIYEPEQEDVLQLRDDITTIKEKYGNEESNY